MLVRLIRLVLVIYGVATLLFLAERVSGDPAEYVLSGAPVTEETVEQFRAAMGLNDPLWVQYVRFLRNVSTGNFGDSFVYRESAMGLVLSRMPVTATLAGAALLVAVIIGIPAGVLAAIKRGTWVDAVVIVLVQLGQAIPVFALALLLVLVFAVNLRWLPVAGSGSLKHLILPAATLGTYFGATFARLTRSSMIDVLSQDYIRTARAKGLRAWTIHTRHALRNAVLPVVTLVALQFGVLLGGAVVVEVIFLWPGVGSLILHAINTRDYTVMEAGVFVIAVLFVLLNFLVDLSYRYLDPRSRGA